MSWIGLRAHQGVVNKFFTTMAVLLAGHCSAGAEDLLQRSYDETFPAPSGEVRLEVARGVIEVSSGAEGDPVKFSVHQRIQRPRADGSGGSETVAAAEAPAGSGHARVFERMAPRFQADAERVRLEIADTRFAVFDWDPSLQMIITVQVSLPPGMKLRVNNTAAGVTLADGFVGDVDIRSEGGSIFAEKVQGDLVARTRTGSITVAEVTGRSDLRSESGLVLAGRLHGPANLRTSVGSVEVNQAFETLSVRGENAEIYVGLSEPLPKSVDLHTSAGAITLNIDRNVAALLDASTGFLGSVRMRGLDPVIERGGPDASRLRGLLNGGGPLVRARTSGGAIALIGREPLDG